MDDHNQPGTSVQHADGIQDQIIEDNPEEDTENCCQLIERLTLGESSRSGNFDYI